MSFVVEGISEETCRISQAKNRPPIHGSMSMPQEAVKRICSEGFGGSGKYGSRVEPCLMPQSHLPLDFRHERRLQKGYACLVPLSRKRLSP